METVQYIDHQAIQGIRHHLDHQGQKIGLVHQRRGLDQDVYKRQAMRYPYSKIVNLGYDEKGGYVYFDVKATSPYPHRFTIRSVNRKNDKTANLCLFFNCLMGYQEK